ncbi:MAG: cytochrome b N-terminal domain-containing protein, partial [Kofleriaceae bacterium]
ASFAYVFGAVLVFLLGVQAVTGAALAAFYSPSSTDAWGSVAYIQDRAAWGWLVRGIHFHGGGAIAIVAGLHLVQTAVAGAYKRPRELVWWLGLALLVLVLAWAVTGYVLRADQAAYWASRVEIGIAAGTPVIGDALRELALGGNDHGNLTLTRFYMLHVVALPALVAVLTVAHVRLARRHGTTAMRSRAAVPRWPHQSLRDSIAMAIALAIVLAVVIGQRGADLGAPADPAQAYDARPLWYFRWLFELRELAGSAERLAALVAPAIVGGFLVGLPLVDRRASRAVKHRLPWLGALAGLLAVVGALTAMSFARDAGDTELAKRQHEAAELAERARRIARERGVPATGPLDLWTTAPMWKGRTQFARLCASCHDEASEDRVGPVIGPGHGDRAWLTAFLQQPSGPRFWGHTKLARGEAAMRPVELPPAELADLVELLYAESGATDVDPARRERGRKVFEACTDCHSLDEGASGSAPNLAGLGSREHYASFIGNPRSALHMGEHAEMPRFDGELSLSDRDAIAEYLVWLRSATAADLAALEPAVPR